MEHWRYFLTLDDDFDTLARYVEPVTANFSVYSLEIARLLMAATQECDVILKQICAREGCPNASNEQEYRKVLSASIPPITSLKIRIPKFGLDCAPFESWQSNRTPDWWTANNKVKHERHLQFARANIENVIGAIAGLYVALLYFYKDEATSADLEPSPKHFSPALPCVLTKSIVVSGYKVPT